MNKTTFDTGSSVLNILLLIIAVPLVIALTAGLIFGILALKALLLGWALGLILPLFMAAPPIITFWQSFAIVVVILIIGGMFRTTTTTKTSHSSY